MRKINKLLLKNSIINYFVLLLISALYSYIFVTKIPEYSTRTYIPLLVILLFGALLSLLFQTLVCFAILKLLKVPVCIKKLHNQLVFLMVLRAITGIITFIIDISVI